MAVFNQEFLHLLLQRINFIFGSEFAEIFLAGFSPSPLVARESPGEFWAGICGDCGWSVVGLV